ncbi:hypothetical protein GCM10007350_09300 [Jeongeupia chitinilytica]|uniref:Uncharacterized protein n=1 Tax=Jeongeupia chitinilytica TaxID=1041641 RepID=A0ABQ3GWQ8_9NEIS|nr:hypothetical protein GCM10007350_09300 [Jeongeupia chitinilytica]
MRVAQAAQLIPLIGRLTSVFIIAPPYRVWGYIMPLGGIRQDEVARWNAGMKKGRDGGPVLKEMLLRRIRPGGSGPAARTPAD